MLLFMRTTLNLDDDVLESARAIADQRGVPIGTVVSDLIRQSLEPSASLVTRNGIQLFPIREGAGPVTPDLVRALMEEAD
jgi:hypothetical protein